MIKRGLFAVIALSLLSLTTTSYANDEVMIGYVVYLKKDIITVEDSETGKEVEVRFDKKTRVTGKLAEDTFVEVEVKKGYAVSIKVIEGDDGFGDEEGKEDKKSEEPKREVKESEEQ